MNKSVLYFLLLFTNSLFGQQNLVPTPSFEEYSSCPVSPGAVGLDELEKATGWIKPNLATSDYYNSCASIQSGVNSSINWMGNQSPFEGDAYVGLIVFEGTDHSVSEYIQCELLEVLKPCQKYKISFRVSLSDYSHFATSSIGMRLDDVELSNPLGFEAFDLPSHLSSDYTIQDTSNWILISGDFEANGGEKFLTIGRFFDSSNGTVPYIVNECDSCSSYGRPCQYYVDSVSVVENNDAFNEFSNSQANVITANKDNINDVWSPLMTCLDWNCVILNRWGNIVYKFSNNETGFSGVDESGSELIEGEYFYKLTNDTGEIKLTGFIQLVR